MAFNSNRLGACDLCFVPYTSPQHKKSHISGKNHKKKLSQISSNHLHDDRCRELPFLETLTDLSLADTPSSDNTHPSNTEPITETTRPQIERMNSINVISIPTAPGEHSEFIKVYEDEDGDFLMYKCTLCSKKLPSDSALISHLSSNIHRKNVSEQPKKFVDLPPIVRYCEDPIEEAYCLTDSIPRGYQVELFEKSYCSNSIIFLPTGTGKTLISIMIISHMLKCNPKRPVLFIVDKVLLALQQYNYILSELKNQKFLRFDPTNIENDIERNLKIICMYGGYSGSAKESLSMHDVIISTAVYCDLRLKEHVLRWRDFSLVVIDEVHHLDKEHPFSKLLKEEHHTLEESNRPQLLGLSASPAGKETIEKTIFMLKTLTSKLSNSKVNIVKEETKELKKYKSIADLEICTVPFQDDSLQYIFPLKKYLSECLEVLNYSDLLRSPDQLDKNFLNEIEERLALVNITTEMEKEQILINHTKKIVSLIIDVMDGGISCIVEELKCLSDPSNTEYSFARVSEIGLHCGNIQSTVDQIIRNQNIPVSAQFKYLIKTIGEYMTENYVLSGLILVMVKRRRVAVELCKLMKTSELVKEKNLSVTSVTGHGCGGGDGMRVNLQRRVFQEIKEGKHQIIITTSVAEEGVDLPKCSLVITMNPPTSVITLVQMRGRARKNGSTFLVICENLKQQENIKSLLSSEKKMEKATEMICNEEGSH